MYVFSHFLLWINMDFSIVNRTRNSVERLECAFYTPYSKMAADLCGYKLALVASFKIKYSFEF